MALAVFAALVPRAVADDGDTEVPAPAEQPAEQPALVTAADEPGGDPLAGAPETGWQLTLVVVPRDWSGDAAGATVPGTPVQPGRDGDPETGTADPGEQAEPLAQQPGAGRECGAAGGCTDRPGNPHGRTLAAVPPDDRPPRSPSPPPDQPGPSPEELAAREREQQALRDEWSAVRAAYEEHRRRIETRDQQALDARWDRRILFPGAAAAMELEQQALEGRWKILRARFAALQLAREQRQQRALDARWGGQPVTAEEPRHAVRESPAAARFRALLARVESIWLDEEVRGGRWLEAVPLAPTLDAPPAQVELALDYLRIRQVVEPLWLELEFRGGQRLEAYDLDLPPSIFGLPPDAEVRPVHMDVARHRARAVIADLRRSAPARALPLVEPHWRAAQERGEEQVGSRLAGELGLNPTWVREALRHLRRQRDLQQGQNPMSVVDEIRLLTTPPTGGTKVRLPALPPTSLNGPTLPGLPPHVAAVLAWLTGAPGFTVLRLLDLGTPPSRATPRQEVAVRMSPVTDSAASGPTGEAAPGIGLGWRLLVGAAALGLGVASLALWSLYGWTASTATFGPVAPEGLLARPASTPG
ncbi:MAG TPA: hypothetical protein VKG45_07595 [Actinomycetes bacterium]|nr:hypothetical protein [Actinomycetes bacterium]